MDASIFEATARRGFGRGLGLWGDDGFLKVAIERSRRGRAVRAKPRVEPIVRASDRCPRIPNPPPKPPANSV